MLHRLAELDELIRKAYAEYDYKRVIAVAVALHEHGPVGVLFRHPQGCALLRALLERQAQGRAGDDRADLPRNRRCGWRRYFASRRRRPGSRAIPRRRDRCIWRRFPISPRTGATMRSLRSGPRSAACAASVTGALEIERANKRIGSSLEAAPQVFVADDALLRALEGVDLAEMCITSGIESQRRSDASRCFCAGGCGRCRRRLQTGRGQEMRAVLANHQGCGQRSSVSRPCPRAMRRRCASSIS